jgi:pimeloyl-ACP methyl ester carboxylesterase
MNMQMRYPQQSPQVNAARERLRDKLNLHPYLKNRELFRLDGGIHCELYPCGEQGAPTVIFLPGIGTYCELYGEMLSKLRDRGFNVVGVDLPGHGYSSGARGLYTVEQVSAIVSKLIDHLQPRFDGPFAMYGYSIGALLGLAAAERDERITAVLCGTLLLPDISPDILHEMGWHWTHTSAFFFPYLHVPLRMFVDFEQLLADHPAGEEINRDPLIVFDYPLRTLSSAFSCRCGVLKRSFHFRSAIIQGDRDEVLPLSYAQRVVARCTQPFELLVLEGASHMVPWLKTEQLVDMSAAWLTRHLVTQA